MRNTFSRHYASRLKGDLAACCRTTPKGIRVTVSWARNPISALYYAAVLNGIVSPLLLFMVMVISNNRKIMQDTTNGRTSNILGWIATIAMGAAAVTLLFSLGMGE